MRVATLFLISMSLAASGFACSSESGQQRDAGTGGGQLTGAAGDASGAGGIGGIGGAAGTGGAGGLMGRGGIGATTGLGGGISPTGRGGRGGGAAGGTTGAGGAIGGTTGAGLAGAGGMTGTGGDGGGGSPGDAGAGGSAGAAGSAGSGGAGARGGAGGFAGGAGSAGGARGGAGGGFGGSPPPALRITRSETLPQAFFGRLMVAVDGQDTAVVVGPSSASEDEDPGPTVTSISLAGASRKTSFPNAITPEAMAVDAAGNIWLAGQLYRPISFGGATLGAVESGYYLAKLTSTASEVFTVAVTRLATPWLRAIATDAQGNAYVVGGISDGGDPSQHSVFVTKFSPSGAQLFDQQFPSQGSSAWASDVAIAPDGEVVIVGAHNTPLQLGATTLPVPTGSIETGFVAALDPATGAVRRAFGFGGPDFDIGNSIEVTSSGALRVSGLLSDAAVIGGMTVQAGAMGSPFVAELTPDGFANWVQLVSPGEGIVFAADTNAAGRTFAVGYITNLLKDTFVATVGPNWPLTLPLRTTIAEDSNGGLFVAADRHGGVWVTGDFKGSVQFGSNTLMAPSSTAFASFLIHLEP
jgi:hypothetical protein